MRIDFYFDIVCPFAAVARRRVARIAEVAEVRYHPVSLGGLLRDLGADPDPNRSMAAAKAALVRLDARRQADWIGAALVWPSEHPRKTLSAMRLLASSPPDRRAALAEDLFHAAWFDPARPDITDRSTLAPIARRHGLDIALIDDPAAKDALRRSTDEARGRGVFGVPTVIADGQLQFGSDRLAILEQQLGLPALPPPPIAVLRDRPVIEWFHDVASPFSYLSSLRIEAMCSALGAELLPRPILVGALFRAIGTPMVPIHTFAEAKARWVRADMERIAREIEAPFVFPSRFPLRSLLAQRILCAEPRARAALYEAAWALDADIEDPSVLSRLLSDRGLDGQACIARASDADIKERLHAHTARAIALGVCGVPSFSIDGTELFWGQDRMEQAAHAARGWRLDAERCARDVLREEAS